MSFPDAVGLTLTAGTTLPEFLGAAEALRLGSMPPGLTAYSVFLLALHFRPLDH